MKIETIEEVLETKPFVPFRFVLPSDRAVPVPHPEFVSISPNRKWILVWNRRGAWRVVEPALIVELTFTRSQRR